jgi:hypothetical protein
LARGDAGPAFVKETPIVIPRLASAPADVGALSAAVDATPAAPLRFRLSREHYRRSEQSWPEAGSPEALVSLGATGDELLIEVSVRKDELTFAPPEAENALDNEHPDTNSDGVQLYVRGRDVSGELLHHSWLVVPEPRTSTVRVTQRIAEGRPLPLSGAWRKTVDGYQVLLRLPLPAFARGEPVQLDLIVNEIPPGRERRRGQLVLSGAAREWAYLQGDRQEPRRYRSFSLAHD